MLETLIGWCLITIIDFNRLCNKLMICDAHDILHGMGVYTNVPLRFL